MLRSRVIPVLLLKGESLVKTVRFKESTYIGDPINAVRIFNDMEVDELTFLDIEASRFGREPNYKLIQQLAEECFMPLAYGGGVTSLAQMKSILALGVEKIVLNTALVTNPGLLRQAAELFGSQSIVASIDVKRNWLGKYNVVGNNGTSRISSSPTQWAIQLANLGAGEILLTSVDRDGTWQGYDLGLVKMISDAVQVPVVASGGAGTLSHLKTVISEGGASAAAAGSMFVFQKQGLGVLISYPSPTEINSIIGVP